MKTNPKTASSAGPKSEDRNRKGIREPNGDDYPQPPLPTRVSISDFGPPSSFGLRTSDLRSRADLPFVRHALLCLGLATQLIAAEPRQTISLNGRWEIAEGAMDKSPDDFAHHVPVPGLVDMASPAFAEVGTTNSHQLREAFWYRRAFILKGSVPGVATLKIHKAAYGARVFLNGTLVGDHLPSFTPGYFDVRPYLRGQGATNELIVRVGAFRDAVPDSVPSGWDFEKTKYIPGIFDSVELILSGTPNIVRVQTVPDVTNRCVRVQTVVHNAGAETRSHLRFRVREARSGRVVAVAESENFTLAPGEERTVEILIPIKGGRLWSPDDPFLYELEAGTGADTVRTRFGLREFHFDPKTGRAVLNGRPWFLRGSNVTLYRFFEDAQRGDHPWREEWVRRLHRRFKEMHWHALRYCIGFPPELWYRIADEEGFLIQDEFPLWHLDKWPAAVKAPELAREYTEWLQERWNHPCVVIWDAQNETRTTETGAAIRQVRSLDLSNRPWDNGWSAAQAPGDCFESHPYLFSNPNFKLADLARVAGVPHGNVTPNSRTNAIILNEYGWLWLNRDGTPTTLTRKVYANLVGADATPARRRQLYARYLAALTEFWRGHRACAGVLHFCGLGYSRPDGQTSDHFVNLETLAFEPNFFRYVRDAFAPVGVMIDDWTETISTGTTRVVPVVVINDLYEPWKGVVRFRVVRDNAVLQEQSMRCEVAGLGEQRLSFKCDAPLEPGRYQLQATLLKAGEATVSSLRDFNVSGR
jgi:urease beta subunit